MFDFAGTGPEVYANHNAPPAVTYSAVIYALRCLVRQEIPLNQGCLAPVTVREKEKEREGERDRRLRTHIYML